MDPSVYFGIKINLMRTRGYHMKNVGFLKFALVALVATSQLTVSYNISAMAQEPLDCRICFDEGAQALHGDHAYCAACLGGHIGQAYAERGVRNQALTCPAQGCNHQITEADVQRVAPNAIEQFREIQQTLIERAKPTDPRALRADRASLLWKFAHTKPCPECRVGIEKNEGCAYMRCNQCNTVFCWECLGRHDHRVHDCVKAIDPWASEKAQLKSLEGNDNTAALTIGGIVLVAAIWLISEYYKWAQSKRATKTQPARPGAKRTVPVHNTAKKRVAARVR